MTYAYRHYLSCIRRVSKFLEVKIVVIVHNQRLQLRPVPNDSCPDLPSQQMTMLQNSNDVHSVLIIAKSL